MALPTLSSATREEFTFWRLDSLSFKEMYLRVHVVGYRHDHNLPSIQPYSPQEHILVTFHNPIAWRVSNQSHRLRESFFNFDRSTGVIHDPEARFFAKNLMAEKAGAFKSWFFAEDTANHFSEAQVREFYVLTDDVIEVLTVELPTFENLVG